MKMDTGLCICDLPERIGDACGNKKVYKEKLMKTREEAVRYGLTFPEVYRDEPFHDPNWTVIRKKKSRKVFLWIFEGVERFLERSVSLCDPCLSSEQKTLEFYYSGRQCTGGEDTADDRGKL